MDEQVRIKMSKHSILIYGVVKPIFVAVAFYDVVGQFITSSYGAKMTSKTVEMMSQIVGMTSRIFMEFTCLVGHFFASSSAV